jgi:CHAT domain-containing protein
MAKQKNTYLKSGLILSAPNEKNEYDNLLSSFEIMSFNWSGVSLVVLSACQTARGELKSGEGVFGIQRALQVSGVNQMIITTHNVYDKSTQIIMKYFYEAIPKTKTYAEALTNVQRKMTKETFHAKPKHWAPFILVHN